VKLLRFADHARSTAYWVLFAACPAYGLFLADIPDLKIYKVLNVIGVIWNILGLVTLSYLTATSEKFQLSSLRISSFLFAILLIQLPIGLMLGAMMAIFMHYPSAKAVFTIGSYLFWPGAISMFLFVDFINPRPRWPATTQKKISLMGAYFLFAGLLVQLFSAAFDLIDFNG